eukprot:3060290-Amphidinium_carterae.2
MCTISGTVCRLNGGSHRAQCLVQFAESALLHNVQNLLQSVLGSALEKKLLEFEKPMSTSRRISRKTQPERPEGQQPVDEEHDEEDTLPLQPEAGGLPLQPVAGGLPLQAASGHRFSAIQ